MVNLVYLPNPCNKILAKNCNGKTRAVKR